ncbi:MAG TPA: hypothetical protein PL151_11345 [Phycisphaerae bacterium]|nr:hypothetical protein [Phycisphaerae bacterium]HOJ73989.1 hypothetical protein [Phycisphaerae bacterium]HOM50930.1 hypothetical protein [Phycisphaerae bacterium]HPP25895.1 hypothetical protein [Phycisphaerae bacterium]HPU26154.1 hypothetical protein [Phycisphaerae bacterium]
MAWIRMGVFICLTLVASTLPADGSSAPAAPSKPVPEAALPHSVPTAPDAAAGQDARPGQPGRGPATPAQPTDSKPVPSDPGPMLQAAPQMDVSRSAPTRPTGGSGSHLLAMLAVPTPAAWKPSPGLGQDLQSHAARVHEHAREWLTCRYPHAPPARA